MLTHVIAVAGLAVMCGAWVLVQNWFRRCDPDQPGVEKCVTCSHHRKGTACRRDRNPERPAAFS